MQLVVKEAIPSVCLNGEIFTLDRHNLDHRLRLLTQICLVKRFIYVQVNAVVFFNIL